MGNLAAWLPARTSDRRIRPLAPDARRRFATVQHGSRLGGRPAVPRLGCAEQADERCNGGSVDLLVSEASDDQGADADVQVRGGLADTKPATVQRLPVGAAGRAQLGVSVRMHGIAKRITYASYGAVLSTGCKFDRFTPRPGLF